MTPELKILACAALLQAVQFSLYSITANLQVGPKVAMGPRDEGVHLTGLAGRYQRAMNNHFEALILFTIAVLVVSIGQQSSQFTTTCAAIYLVARVLYIPAYALGLSPWRSLIWFAGFVATMAMIVAALI